MLKATEVFKINGFPEHSYVDRAETKIEQQLTDAFDIENSVVSVSGPSKSGKTVLISKIVGTDNLITIPGSAIRQPSDVWRTVLAWMGAPSEISTGKEQVFSGAVDVSGGGEIGVPLVAKGKVEGSVTGAASRSNSTTGVLQLDPMTQVVREIGKSDFVVFIDDFHYIPRDLQEQVAKEIKSLAEQGVKICTASVPHRADDVVRNNPELRGRLAVVNLAYWSSEDLKNIAKTGFSSLNMDVDGTVVAKLSREALGSPQLMQALCLNLCLELNHREKKSDPTNIAASSDQLESVLLRSSVFSDYSSLVENLHSGPRQRGTQRKTFPFSDGSEGDVYRCVLLAIAADPASQQIRYDEFLKRVRTVCVEDEPVGSSVSESLRQLATLTEKSVPQTAILEWDEDVLNVVEPYFLFYLRCSDKLANLG
ncbi:hypothetical protein [uncultured Litoreibacter sp.]|uniref:hypothetical protein n=1 Tax=uncultured Litoreibacter sp. TaxID=1392394 RepID=UPI0026082D30|nr:hypothetical protein [uncultured Litoreibacter sp.]